MIGRRIAHYKIQGRLGAGGMGEVYLADDLRLDRKVALKILPLEMAEDPDRLRRFEREVKLIASISHPNIVTIYSVEESEGVRFFTMEVVEGETLSEIIPDEGMSNERFVDIALQIVSAMATVHERGITHRDLKPENVMVNRFGRVKILDFGLAKRKAKRIDDEDTLTRVEGARVQISQDQYPDKQLEGARGDPILTEAGRILGSGPYMSPEQIYGDSVGTASDVFSLGVVLYQMKTGERPFHGATFPALLQSILTHTPRFLGESERKIPERLKAILEQCLEKDPGHRTQTAGELLKQLSKWNSEELTVTTEIFREYIKNHQYKSRRLKAKWLAAGALAVVVSFSSFFYLGKSGNKEMASFRTDIEGQAGEAAPQQRAEKRDRKILAVLHFENLTRDADSDWLKTGLADMLVTDLSRIPDIDVLSIGATYETLQKLGLRSSAMAGPESIKEFAKETGATFVVTGSFAKAGTSFRASVALVDSETGDIIASGSQEGSGPESVFSIVDELSKDIRRHLAMTGIEKAESSRGISEFMTSSLAAYRFYTEAIGLHMQSKNEEAISLMKRAVEQDPDFALAYVSLSSFHTNLGRQTEGREYIRKAIELAERLPEHRRHQIEGKYYYTQWKDFHLAINSYKSAVELYPGDEQSRSQLALLYAMIDDIQESVEQYEELLERGNTFAPHYYLLAQGYGELGQFDKSRQILENYIRQYSEKWFGWVGLGWHLAHWGYFEESRAAFVKADELRPGALFIQNGRWRLEILAENWDASAEEAEAMTTSSNEYGRWRGYVSLARTRLYEGHGQEAIELFRRAIDVYDEPEAFTAITNCWIGEVYLARGELENALEEARICTKDGVHQWPERQGFFLSAFLEQKLGREEAAKKRQATLESLREEPLDIERRQHLFLDGLLALERNETAGALAKLHDAETYLHPHGVPAHWQALSDHVPLWNALAEAELRAGNDEAAVAYLEKINDSLVEHIEFPIPYVRSYYRLAKLYEKHGEGEKAREMYRQFVHSWQDGDLDRDEVADARSKL